MNLDFIFRAFIAILKENFNKIFRLVASLERVTIHLIERLLFSRNLYLIFSLVVTGMESVYHDTEVDVEMLVTISRLWGRSNSFNCLFSYA